MDKLALELAAAIPPQSVGLGVRRLADRANVAAKGSTPFGILFLTLSSFLVVAALILLWLVFWVTSLLTASNARRACGSRVASRTSCQITYVRYRNTSVSWCFCRYTFEPIVVAGALISVAGGVGERCWG